MKRSLIIRTIVAVAILLTAVPISISAQTDSAGVIQKKQRPRIGLVLSGGGAKGAAHIGVLKVLEELDIPVDYIAGTSMGSIIGAMYAAGYDPYEMDSIISNLDWSRYMMDKIDREYLSYSEKKRKREFLFSIPLSFGQSKKTKEESRADAKSFISSLPAGVIGGNNLITLFNSLFVGYQDSLNFKDLPIPFACVATDIVTGDEVVFKDGRLPYAIRASMAIPGVFSPVRIENMVLADGGMVNNFPVDVCKSMGADIVIGVKVAGNKVPKAEDLNSLPEQVGRLLGIVTQAKTSENIKECYMCISPDLKDYGMLSFDKGSISDIIEMGYKSADELREPLVQLKEYLNTFGHNTKTLHAPKAMNMYSDTIFVTDIRINGVSSRDSQWLMRRFRFNAGTDMTGQDIEEKIYGMKGMNIYKNVNYTLSDNEWDDGYTLDIDIEASQPHSFSAGVRFDTQEAASFLADLGINHYRLTGFKMDVAWRFSYNPWGKIELSYVPGRLPNINLGYYFKSSDMSLRDLGVDNNSIEFYKQRVALYLSEFYTKNYSVKIGTDITYYHNSKLLLADSKDPFYNTRDSLHSVIASLYGEFSFDNTDRSEFPTSGVRMDLNASWKYADLLNKAEFLTFGDVRLRFESFIPLGDKRFVLMPQVYGRYLITRENHLAYENFVGSSVPGRFDDHQLPFVGILHPEYCHPLVVIGRLDFRVNFLGRHYISLMYNFIRDAVDIQSFFTKATQWNETYMSSYLEHGAGIGYSYDIPVLGPITLELSTANKKFQAYLSLGHYF
ncbi:MAG: patatin-like phospholipase family protein [Candidatus Coprenecus sp.]